MCFVIVADFLPFMGTKIRHIFNSKLPSYWYNIFDHLEPLYKKSLIRIHTGMQQK